MAMRVPMLRRSLARSLPPRLILSVYPNLPATSFQSRALSKLPLPSTSRRFQTRSTLREKWISSEVITYECKHRKVEKWGWVFYRTTYQDDEAWDNFKQCVNISVRDIISADSRSELNQAMFDKLEYIFIEDKAKFDGASKQELRINFQEWAPKCFAAENPRADPKLIDDNEEPVPRYRFFFEADENALRSCMYSKSGYMNFVDGFWSSEHRSSDPKFFTHNQAEATTVCSDVGWMKMDMAFFMDPHFYGGMSSSVEMMWPFLYESPPAVVPNTKLIRMIQIQNMCRQNEWSPEKL